MKKLLTLFAILFATAFTAQNHQNVDAVTFKKLMEDKNSILIDLRTNDELKNKGFIKGAKQIDYFGKNAEDEIKKLDKDKTYLIYCAGGGRSGECVDLMNANGFKHIVNLEHGFDDWKKKGFDIENK